MNPINQPLQFTTTRPLSRFAAGSPRSLSPSKYREVSISPTSSFQDLARKYKDQGMDHIDISTNIEADRDAQDKPPINEKRGDEFIKSLFQRENAGQHSIETGPLPDFFQRADDLEQRIANLRSPIQKTQKTTNASRERFGEIASLAPLLKALQEKRQELELRRYTAVELINYYFPGKARTAIDNHNRNVNGTTPRRTVRLDLVIPMPGVQESKRPIELTIEEFVQKYPQFKKPRN